MLPLTGLQLGAGPVQIACQVVCRSATTQTPHAETFVQADGTIASTTVAGRSSRASEAIHISFLLWMKAVVSTNSKDNRSPRATILADIWDLSKDNHCSTERRILAAAEASPTLLIERHRKLTCDRGWAVPETR